MSTRTRKKATNICAECGQEYTTLQQTMIRTQKRFGEYVCPICARKLGAQKRKQNFLNKYGVDNPMKVIEFKENMQQTQLERYGYKTPFANPKIQKIIHEHYKEQTGYDNPAQNPEVQEKIMTTCLEKYGFKYGLAAPEVREKIIQSMYKNETIPTSQKQKECYEILKDMGYEVELNYPEGPLSLDILIRVDNILIDFEYDGWYWHQDKQKDCARNAVVRDLGYKIFRVKALKDTVPSKEQIEEGINKLISTDDWIYYIEIS